MQPSWELSYRFSREYGLPNASPEAVPSLVGALVRDRDLVEVFQRHLFKALMHDFDRDRVPKCDDNCRKTRLCDGVRYFSPERQDKTKENKRVQKMVHDKR